MNVQISASARRQAEQIDRWWRDNRPAAPNRFARELAQARELLASSPELGPPYGERNGAVVRRLFLRTTRNHVYYEIDRGEGVVMIIAVWGAPKERGPRL